MSRELLQQALDALETHVPHVYKDRGYPPIDALRAALAQPEPEPAAHLYDDGTWIATQTAAGRSLNDRMLFAGSPKIGVYTVATPPAAPIDGFGGNLDEAFERAPAAHPDEFTCPYCFDQGAAPAPAVPLTDEQFADMVADASLAVDLAANPIKLLAFARAVLSAAPAVREPQYWCPETGELCGKCAKTGTCEASILQAHGIKGGGK